MIKQLWSEEKYTTEELNSWPDFVWYCVCCFIQFDFCHSTDEWDESG